MKEIKYILHAFLLLLAFIIVFICLNAIYLIRESEPAVVIADKNSNAPAIFSKGKLLFQAKCGACHVLNRNFTGPDLCGFESRGPWSVRENVYEWIKSPIEFMKKDQYIREVKEGFNGVMMTAFPDLPAADIDEIINYINNSCNPAIAKN